jgi:hypothetical protein
MPPNDLDRLEGETLDQYRARLYEALGPMPQDNPGDYNQKRDAVDHRINYEVQKEEMERQAAQRQALTATASPLDEVKRQVRRLNDVERQQLILWLANGFPGE